MNIYDDGRQIEQTYENGVVTRLFAQDTDDVFPWQNYEITYNAAGERLMRTMLMDDGIDRVTEFEVA